MIYKIVEMQTNELKETLELVKYVFDEFEAPYYTKEGIQNFYNFIDYDNTLEQLNNHLKIFVVKNKEKIIGMICIRDYSHIAMLFVDKNYHKKGIGTDLINKATDFCKNNNTKEITVNSSPYAIAFYHKIGFKDTDKEQTIDGIIFLPMKMLI